MKSKSKTAKQNATFANLMAEHANSEGKIQPTLEAFQFVEAHYADRPEAERYRLAQAQTLIALQQLAMGESVPHME